MTDSLKLFIKNMVCGRCIKVVKEEIEKFGIKVSKIQLGEVELERAPDKTELARIREILEMNGFELIEDKRAKLIEKIKSTIISTIYQNESFFYSGKKFSELIELEVRQDYHYLSSLFSSLESMTIEQYIILQKVERVKELLKYGEFTLSEISYKLGYSSVQHLSNQFKKVTGLSASKFKNLTRNTRKPLDKINS